MTDGRDGPKRLPLAVIIPTLDEETRLPATLEALAGQTEPADQVVVVDGGSRDRTVAVARRAGATVVESADSGTPRGRGGQIGAGLEHVTAEVVLVAHADMILPPTALERIRAALVANPGAPGGCLGHRFEPTRWSLRLVEAADRLRLAWTGISYGDQAQFFRRAPLQAAGGFPAQPIMEDVELARRLAALGRPLALGLPVVVSARRFERLGFWRTIAINLQLRWTYRRHGLDACHALYRRYYGQ